MSRVVVLFQSTHDAIKAERLCIGHRLECRIIAVPRSISSDCGIGLEMKEDLIPTLSSLLDKNDITFSRRQLPT
jgi:hypothetical protein